MGLSASSFRPSSEIVSALQRDRSSDFAVSAGRRACQWQRPRAAAEPVYGYHFKVEQSRTLAYERVPMRTHLAPNVGYEGLEPIGDGIGDELEGEDYGEEEVDLLSR